MHDVYGTVPCAMYVTVHTCGIHTSCYVCCWEGGGGGVNVYTSGISTLCCMLLGMSLSIPVVYIPCAMYVAGGSLSIQVV